MKHLFRLSELLYLPMPTLPVQTRKTDSIIVGTGSSLEHQEEIYVTGGKWEDEEERKFYEDIQDLRDFVPKSVLGIDDDDDEPENATSASQNEQDLKEMEELEAKELEKELSKLSLEEPPPVEENIRNGKADSADHDEEEDELRHFIPRIVTSLNSSVEPPRQFLRHKLVLHIPRLLLLKVPLKCLRRCWPAYRIARIVR